ncbi:sugar phosphate nucleotidyltransferase [Sporolactobacillus shoreicorticis]|uniref:Sugar phosphate nucleotidyltransferase n=1 Tax=Sporolactobacillus shoreicorticis TaxID=1923877 RepID=A0ABW5S3J1_9BACL|nr:sugar phosphate nucleotidyltransferase [Sporolactobacillus shoreicorticis]MCO7124208.1 sugar phosphate nucleotidyltransferase [Sporolactobacillus shoreicorticis]
MKLVLLSGGSGKRLWPLSNDIRSKQFLKVLKAEAGQKQSMVQRVWEQLKAVHLEQATVIAASNMQSEMIRSQLNDHVPLIIEPERRDTFPAITLAASYLYSVARVAADEVVAVLPVDPFVANSFFERVKDLQEALEKTDAELALIGVQPTYPSSKYGYIVPDPSSDESNYEHVSHFTEKPTEHEAARLIEQHALWNCGVFAFKLGRMLDLMSEKGMPLEFEKMQKHYSLLPKISFDYEVVEKAKSVVVLPYSGYWKDLGTWNTLTEEMASSQIGKGVISEATENTHLINELDIPVTVHGVKNLIVAASPDGILVSDKSMSPQIKDLISGFNQPPMYEERMWGWSRTLDYAKYANGEEMVTKRICIDAGKNSTYHYHHLRDEVWTIVKGEGEIALENAITRVKAGDIVHLPAQKKHAIRAITQVEFIEVQTGRGISNQDFVRICYKWKDVIEQFYKSKAQVIS